jgi:hypothetical protein
MFDDTSYVRRGDGVRWGRAGAEPGPLVDALFETGGRDRPAALGDTCSQLQAQGPATGPGVIAVLVRCWESLSLCSPHRATGHAMARQHTAAAPARKGGRAVAPASLTPPPAHAPGSGTTRRPEPSRPPAR